MKILDVKPPNQQERPLKPLPTSPKIVASSKNPKFDTKSLWSVLGFTIFFILVATGLIEPLLESPHITVGLYIILALGLRLKSRVSFVIAFLLLLFIPVLLLLGQTGLAETYAVFCFYFLVVGITMAFFELRTSVK